MLTYYIPDMNLGRLPKIELHLHLDCSLSFKVVQQLAPHISYEAYRDAFVAPPKCTDLADYISRAISGFELMQTEAQLRLVTLDLFEQLKADHVLYAEIRYAPLQHTFKSLSPEAVVAAVNNAVLEGINKTGVQAAVILCTLRHYSSSQSMQTVQLVEQFKNTPVVGFDIAADEAGFPIQNHIAAFTNAQKNGISCTAHAGEAKGPESVWETLTHFHPQRIGHGVRSIEDPALLAHLVSHNIHLEVCPTSNVQTDVVPAIKDHPVDRLYKAGVSLSINTDARTISDTTLTKEYRVLQQQFAWGKEELLHCNLQAVAHAFTSPERKAALILQLQAGFSLA